MLVLVAGEATADKTICGEGFDERRYLQERDQVRGLDQPVVHTLGKGGLIRP